MALQIIGAGFGRTGTLSIYSALNQLGFPCYHMYEVLEKKENKSHVDFWFKVANAEPGTQQDWEQIFSKYTAAIDNPACCVWRELMAAYPDAKVLLTVHPGGAQAWYESSMNTIYPMVYMWQFKVLEFATPHARKLGSMIRKLVWQRSHKGIMNNRDKAIAHYHQHIDHVKASVPEDRLLLFSVDQGWKPLCDFLGVAVPESEFPRLNDREAFKKKFKELTLAALIVIGLGLITSTGLVYAAIRFFL
ncbi:MAG: hypothetical protein KKC46_06830 [Proteobacteria bacterium]|nr:hypothetical protein [Pseudomonadota bacterium]